MSQDTEGSDWERDERERKERETESRADAVVVDGWLRQNNLILGGLIGVGIVFVQPYLAVPELSVAARVCVTAFAVSIPLLAALILVNALEKEYERLSDSRIVAIARPIALASAVVGLTAGFWEISWQAAIALIVSGIAAGGVHSAGYARLENAQRPRSALRDDDGANDWE